MLRKQNGSMANDKENLALTEFKDIARRSGIKNLKIYQTTDPFIFGEYKEGAVFLSTSCDETGLTFAHKEAVILHEIGHKVHNIKQKLITLFAMVAPLLLSIFFLFLAFLMLLSALTNLRPPTLLDAIFVVVIIAIVLVLAIISFSIAGSAYIFTELEADNHARRILSNIGKSELVNDIHRIILKHPNRFEFSNIITDRTIGGWTKLKYLFELTVISIIRFFISRDEWNIRLINRDWIWIPWTYRKQESPIPIWRP